MSPNVPDNRQNSVMRWFFLAGLGFVSWFTLASILQTPVPPSPAEDYLSKKDVVKAEAEFEKIVRGAPNAPASYYAIILICQNQKRFDIGLRYLERGLHACKDAPKIDRANLYFLQYRLLAATEPKPQLRSMAALQRATIFNPNSPEFLNEYGYLMADALPQGDPRLAEAIAILSRALTLLKPDENPVTHLLNLKSEQDKEQLTPQVEDSYGWALYKQGKFDPAYNALSQAVGDAPKMIFPDKISEAASMKVLQHHLGAAALRTGKKEEARRALNASLGYDKNYQEAKNAMAELDKK